VIPDDRKELKEIKEILILQGDSGNAKTGDKVVSRMYPPGHQGRIGTYGKILEVLGPGTRPDVIMLGILRKHGLPEAFPAAVLEEAAAIPETVTPEMMEGRRDLSGLLMVTIDGADARDLDDAVSLEPLGDGVVRLGVHIADVGWYVKEGSALDSEALARGTSVYFPDRVLPMLPPRLSNHICSLNPQAPRLALSCVMDVNAQGLVAHYEIMPTLINVTQRLTYDQVQAFLDQGTDCFSDPRLKPMILDMSQLCHILKERRTKRGAVEFDLPECKIIVDEKGVPTDIYPRKQRAAEMLIEEFMILANETVASHFHKLKIPFLYRVHEEPDADSILELNRSLAAFGLFAKTNKSGGISSAVYQKMLNAVKGRPEAQTVSLFLLRSMQHARYDSKALGHFGLASKEYSHFTSPIRRYADLAIHRAIREAGMEGRMNPQRVQVLEKQMQRYAQQISEREKIAETAERDVEAFKKAEYMGAFIGKEFDGIISNVTEFGFYVRLPNTVEGLVHVNQIEGYYVFNEKRLRLENARQKHYFTVGGNVTVRLIKTDPQSGFIDFEWKPAKTQAKDPPAEAKKRKKSRSRSAKAPQPPVLPAKTKAESAPPPASPASTASTASAASTKAAATPAKNAAERPSDPGNRGRRRHNENIWRFKDPAFDLDEPQGFKYTAKTLADWINPDNYNAAAAKPVHPKETKSEIKPADHVRQRPVIGAEPTNKAPVRRKRRPQGIRRTSGEQTNK
jgi:ribonuclease R